MILFLSKIICYVLLIKVQAWEINLEAIALDCQFHIPQFLFFLGVDATGKSTFIKWWRSCKKDGNVETLEYLLHNFNEEKNETIIYT